AISKRATASRCWTTRWCRRTSIACATWPTSSHASVRRDARGRVNMPGQPAPHADVLEFDAIAEADRFARWIVDTLAKRLHRRGLVVAISGGIDSSVCAALAVRAIGP